MNVNLCQKFLSRHCCRRRRCCRRRHWIVVVFSGGGLGGSDGGVEEVGNGFPCQETLFAVKIVKAYRLFSGCGGGGGGGGGVGSS